MTLALTSEDMLALPGGVIVTVGGREDRVVLGRAESWDMVRFPSLICESHFFFSPLTLYSISVSHLFPGGDDVAVDKADPDVPELVDCVSKDVGLRGLV